MNRTLASPFGKVQVKLENKIMLAIKGETDLACIYGQGYATARLRLWQLDLSRRIASGRLAEVLGPRSRKSDIFQRKLGLTSLARRDAEKASRLMETGGAGLTVEEAKDRQQAFLCRAYLTGLNQGLSETRFLPVEFLLLRYRPNPFSLEDIFLAAHLKYFINSAWQFEIFHTRLTARLEAFSDRSGENSSHNATERTRQPDNSSQTTGNASQTAYADLLFGTVSEEGTHIPPLAREAAGTLRADMAEALRDGLRGLELLGLASPDTGSNVFAVSGQRSKTGKPLLGADPHMGQVNPGFNLLCDITSDEGLKVSGSHFPGIPGIVVGRNRHAAWGMVGIMADNQDLFWGEVDLKNEKIHLADGWMPLERREENIAVRGKKNVEIFTFGFAGGRLIQAAEGYGLFLRWPALDAHIGDFTLYDLARCTDWQTFRQGISRMHNAPMMVGYADVHGDIGLHLAGLYPKRKREAGSLVQNIANPTSEWLGYAAFDELPSLHNPPEGYVVYANQYSTKLFDKGPHISMRWHPPSRALRIKERITECEKHDLAGIALIQDDKVDIFARDTLPWLLSFISGPSPLNGWDGNTTDVKNALFFDRWMALLCREAAKPFLGVKTTELYRDFWPGWRWSTINLLKIGKNKKELAAAINETHRKACADKREIPDTELQHSLKKGVLSHLFTGRSPYNGGNRETVHATRQNTDFLTASQGGGENKTKKDKPFSFGPAFKIAASLTEDAEMLYFANAPARGCPFFWKVSAVFKDWLNGRRIKATLKQQE